MPQTTKVSEIRTQIYFPQSLYRRAKQHAAARKVSFATIVRNAVEKEVGFTKNQTPTYDLLDVAGIIKNEASDVSVNFSKYVKQMYQEKTP